MTDPLELMPEYMIYEQVMEQLKIEIQALGSQKAFALRHNVSQGYVNDVLAGRREPGEKILKALNLEKVVLYRRRPSCIP